MHRFSQYRPGGEGMPIQGTFYPSSEQPGVASVASVLPKVLAVVVAMAVLRTIVGAARHHRGGSRWSRRREAIAEFHRELHAQDEATKA